MSKQKDYSKIDLDVKHYRNGDPIRFVENPNEWSKLTEGAYCYSSNGSLLYNHYAVMDERGLAPDGFRIPNKDELFNLKNSNLNLNGFRCNVVGSLYDVGRFGNYWSSTVSGPFTWYLNFSSGHAHMYSNYRAHGFSVRCVKDTKTTNHNKQMEVKMGKIKIKIKAYVLEHALTINDEVQASELIEKISNLIRALGYHEESIADAFEEQSKKLRE